MEWHHNVVVDEFLPLGHDRLEDLPGSISDLDEVVEHRTRYIEYKSETALKLEIKDKRGT